MLNPESESAASSSLRWISIDDEALSDLHHSLGNHFHKLYYWAERLGPAKDPEAPQIQSLTETVRSLEKLMRIAMDYLRPIDLRPVEMGGGAMVDAVEAVLRSTAPGSPVEVSAGPGVSEVVVEVDPGRISTVLHSVAGELDACGARRVGFTGHVHCAPANEGGALEIELGLAGEGIGPTGRPERNALHRALARRVLETHGGRLHWRKDPQGAPGCTISLPSRTAVGQG